MKFAPFSYLRATDAAEAVRLFAEAREAAGGARFIAGARAFCPRWPSGWTSPRR